MRKTISKALRQQVFDKYAGHCAYCGTELSLCDMQVDHANSVSRAEYKGEEADNSLSNLMPACRACNFYKSVYTVEQFRNRIKEELAHTCIRTFQTRLAMQYGIISYHKWDGRFYFENLKNNEI